MPIALGILQNLGQESLQGEFALKTLGGLRERLQHFQSPGEVTNGLGVCRVLVGPLARTLPIIYSLRAEAGFRVMMRQQFRLGLDSLGKLPLQYLGDVLVIMLPPAPQQ